MNKDKIGFELLDTDEGARRGRITTGRGVIETPAFMPVGTLGTVKAMTPEEVSGIGFEMILSNTYHLYLRPGHELIRDLGGLHKFMNWSGPILTDSGGYQVFSLAKLRKITEEGVDFQSHLDGAKCRLTPESVIDIQLALGSDIMMPLDECPPHTADNQYIKDSMDRTLRWLERSKRALEVRASEPLASEPSARNPSGLFGIVQGGMDKGLRQESVRGTVDIDLDGYSIGGLSVGEEKSLMYEMTGVVTEELPKDKVRYLMGVGMPEDIVQAVALGVDIFDCVLPTRMARNGTLFTSEGKLVIKNSQHEKSDEPIEQGCGCYTCRNYSRAYVRHIFMSREILASRLCTIHNLYYYHSLMSRMRQAITEGSFSKFVKDFHSTRES
jgi:queuine tRNA-ribosyltransferase